MTLRDGAAMARARQIFDLTVDDMAAHLGLPVAELRDIEAGRDLAVKTRNKIEAVLGFSLDDLSPRLAQASEHFTAQPYPLFLSSLDKDATDAEDILIGRVIGWDTVTYPKPMVIFESNGFDFPPIVVNTMADPSATWPPTSRPTAGKLTWAGPMWIRDTRDEAAAAAKAYLDGRHD